MKTLLLGTVTAVALSVGAIGAAQAGLSISGGTAGTLPTTPGITSPTDTNAALAGLGYVSSLGGYFGATVSITAGSYLFEYLGRESTATNTFNYLGLNGDANFSLTTAGSNANAFNINGIGTEYVRTLGAGVLDFSFATTVGSVTGPNPRLNASNIVPTPNDNRLNWFVTFQAPPGSAASGGTSGDVLYLFLDDTGGNGGPDGDDDNHDDMVVRISVVPEPATLALFGAGLLGLGLARRRRA